MCVCPEPALPPSEWLPSVPLKTPYTNTHTYASHLRSLSLLLEASFKSEMSYLLFPLPRNPPIIFGQHLLSSECSSESLPPQLWCHVPSLFLTTSCPLCPGLRWVCAVPEVRSRRDVSVDQTSYAREGRPERTHTTGKGV